MIFASSTQKLQVVLGAAKTTNDCNVTAAYRALGGTTLGQFASTNVLTPQVTNTNGVTAVDIVAAPTITGQINAVESLFIYNADTVPTTVTVQYYNGGTAYPLVVIQLQVGETLCYSANQGFYKIASSSPIGRLTALSVAGTLFNTYTTAKTILPAANVVTLPANWFAVGKVIMIEGVVGLSNIVTTPGLFNLQVKLGSVVAFDTGNIQLNATAHTLLPLWFKIMLTCRAVGSGTSANLMGQGIVYGVAPTVTAGQTDGANTMSVLNAPATAPAVGTGFDSTTTNNLDLWAGFTISNSGNGIQVQQYLVTAY